MNQKNNPIIVKLPLFVTLPRKKVRDKRVRMNLNIYRNTHPIVNNSAKAAFAKAIRKQVEILPIAEVITISYTLYPDTARLCDVANICSIVDKYFCDTLTKHEIIPDDNYHHIIGVQYLFGSIDREDPRVDARIKIIEPVK